jgi:hypothetical protein
LFLVNSVMTAKYGTATAQVIVLPDPYYGLHARLRREDRG